MTLIIMAILTIVALTISFLKSKGRSQKALGMASRMGKGMVLEILTILSLLALGLSFVSDELIASLLGQSNGLSAIVAGALLGTVTILPGVIAFPLARELLVAGAGLAALAAFITTLTMVGLATGPLEAKHFGLRFTLVRNGLSLGFAIIIATVMGAIL
jgi:uncharacterized membrane protein YraQ (UPF0718 family)